MTSLKPLQEGSIVAHFLHKPAFLSDEQEDELLSLLQSEDWDKFFDLTAELISNSNQIAHLYVYLLKLCETRGHTTEALRYQVSWRLFNMSRAGWLGLHDPQIIRFCRDSATDPEMHKELAETAPVGWFHEYVPYLAVEKRISSNFDVEEDVEQYLSFLEDLLARERISRDSYDEVLGHLIKELSIYKGREFTGMLVSQATQQSLGIEKLAPHLSVQEVIRQAIEHEDA